MLLHGVRGADIRLQDTLLHPQHRDGETLERFDRVIANPPFSQNYTRSGMEFPERFQWGWCPTSGKKGDLMFAQHMLHVCKPDGMVATVMPHGVLFRGGAEKEIRKKFLEQDLVEAVIGLPPNLFYGAGIPACILVMRPNYRPHLRNSGKPAARRDLNAVRADFLTTFTTALAPLDALDHFKLTGVIATWWTDTIPDFKTLMENGFRGVLDGWVDAVADALEDDEAAGPAFDPFSHKLMHATMADYLERIAATKREIARLKGEKEAFEQSNAPEDLDEEELAAWQDSKGVGSEKNRRTDRWIRNWCEC